MTPYSGAVDGFPPPGVYIEEIYRTDISFDTTGKEAELMLELAILGLLKERSMHGYQLSKRLSDTLGGFWRVS